MDQTNDIGAQGRKAAREFETAFDAFTASLPNFQIPAAFREFAERSTTQALDVYGRFKTVAEETTDVLGETYEAARDNALAVGRKTLELTKANADASLDFYKDLIGAKTLADALELQAAFARRQFDAFTGQVREIQELTQRAAVETGRPARTAFEKAFKEFKAA